MKVIDVIEKVDDLKPNSYSFETKVSWLSQLEEKIYEELVKTHDNPLNIGYSELNEDNTEMELIAPDRFEEMYIVWIFTKIDFYNGEMSRYNNSALLFNTLYQEFANYWNRTYMPKSVAETFKI